MDQKNSGLKVRKKLSNWHKWPTIQNRQNNTDCCQKFPSW